VNAVEDAFGSAIDYAMLVKIYGSDASDVRMPRTMTIYFVRLNNQWCRCTWARAMRGGGLKYTINGVQGIAASTDWKTKPSWHRFFKKVFAVFEF
jgi:hypothetical protein